MTHKTPSTVRPSVKKPASSTAHRQPQVPKVLQAKMPDRTQKSSKTPPAAPPVYRPQPVPRVLQAKILAVLQPKRQIGITPVVASRAVIQRAEKERRKGPRRKEGKQEAVITVGKISMTFDDFHRTVKPTLMAKIDAGALLGRKGATNVDFYFERDGTILVGENNSGGKNGVDTELNLFDIFPSLRPQEVAVAAQQRNFDLPPTDSDDDDDGH